MCDNCVCLHEDFIVMAVLMKLHILINKKPIDVK